jgi:hypothetical protein
MTNRLERVDFLTMALVVENYKSKSKAECSLPDLAVCRVRRAEVNGLFYCLTENSACCQHVEAHANKLFCFHPDPSKLKS